MEEKFHFKKYFLGVALIILLLSFYFILNNMPKNEKDWYEKEVKTTKEKDEDSKKCCGPDTPPDFDLGLEFLGIENSNNEGILWTNINKFVDNWFENPEKFMRLNEYNLPKDEDIKIKDDFIEFPSILNKNQTARFKYNPQSDNSVGRKVALIYLMHLNGKLKYYDSTVSILRGTFLPISTLIHIPAGRGDNPGDDSPADYESVSPNIGKTIFKTRQDVMDIQFMAKYLKEKLGYKEVGLFTYSIGSLKGIISSIFEPDFFDFAVFHMAADNFTDSVMKGTATEDIAKKIEGKIDMNLLNTMWLTISPGRYSSYLKNLPKKTRIIQAEYDYVFGPKNVDNFDYIVKKVRPDIEIKEELVGHSTFDYLPVAIPVMMNDIKFIYENTFMKEHFKSNLFGI